MSLVVLVVAWATVIVACVSASVGFAFIAICVTAEFVQGIAGVFAEIGAERKLDTFVKALHKAVNVLRLSVDATTGSHLGVYDVFE